MSRTNLVLSGMSKFTRIRECFIRDKLHNDLCSYI